MQVDLPLVGEQACLDAYPRAAIDGRTLCAGLKSGDVDSCQGDSGGPLVVRDGDEWVQVGVVSWGISCAKPGKYGVYTNVGAFAEWVNETTGRELVASGGAADAEDPDPAPPRGDRALVIGINRYADSGITDLPGAVNDARNMRDLLSGHLGFDPGQIRVLTDTQATREGILDGVRDWLVAGTRPGARALLYFAGHGYYQPDRDGDEPDGQDEALVPHDAWIESATDSPMRVANLILDDEIGALFDGLADRWAYLIVDSCFSGTITPLAGGTRSARRTHPRPAAQSRKGAVRDPHRPPECGRGRQRPAGLHRKGRQPRRVDRRRVEPGGAGRPRGVATARRLHRALRARHHGAARRPQRRRGASSTRSCSTTCVRSPRTTAGDIRGIVPAA